MFYISSLPPFDSLLINDAITEVLLLECHLPPDRLTSLTLIRPVKLWANLIRPEEHRQPRNSS